ncbi:MAG: S1 RNA-binding domain-containing protein [bacterium]|nr:S1 RNA-binding domain-containing protein [bacterium]
MAKSAKTLVYKTHSKSGSPSTMEELLAQSANAIKTFRRGNTVTGRVTEMTGRSVYVDVGGKAEGIVADREYEAARDFVKTLKVGDEITAYVTSPENDSGQVILSLKRAAADSRWKVFEDAFSQNSTLTVRGKEVNKGGLVAEVEGVYGFIPASQLSKEVVGQPETLVNKPVQVKVIEVDREQNRLVLSEKAVSEAEDMASRKKLLEKVEQGAIYSGKVVGIVPFGAFIEVQVGKGKTAETLEGLVHISEISWEKIEDVSKVLKEGNEVQVKVIGTDEDSGKLALSIKQLTDDPWLEMSKKYTVDSKHHGQVVKVMPYGVIVHMEKGIEGLIHASKMPPEMNFAEGQEVEVFVESVDMDKRRLSLGMVLTEKPVGYK